MDDRLIIPSEAMIRDVVRKIEAYRAKIRCTSPVECDPNEPDVFLSLIGRCEEGKR